MGFLSGLFGGDAPSTPDPGEVASQALYTQLMLLPVQRRIEVGAALGIPVRAWGGETDFSGMGEADYQLSYADQMLAAMLGIQQEYGPGYVRQRLAEMELAQPEWFAARRALFNEIAGDVGTSAPSQQMSADLEQQILGELKKGGELDPLVARDISQQVRGQQAARGNVYGAAPVAQEAGALAGASDQMRSLRQQQAMQFLTTGISPEDISYRRNQQTMSNLGSFYTGQTPQAQFGALQGAQQGAAPFYTTQLSGVNQNAYQQAAGFNSQLASIQNDFYNQTVNPWIAGLGGAMQGAAIGTAASGVNWGGQGGTGWQQEYLMNLWTPD